VDFDDRLGVGAIVIQGEYPQKHMKNAQGRVLCLFHKKTRTPYISEAPTYFASRPVAKLPLTDENTQEQTSERRLCDS
jgi:hypothetical protein